MCRSAHCTFSFSFIHFTSTFTRYSSVGKWDTHTHTRRSTQDVHFSHTFCQCDSSSLSLSQFFLSHTHSHSTISASRESDNLCLHTLTRAQYSCTFRCISHFSCVLSLSLSLLHLPPWARVIQVTSNYISMNWCVCELHSTSGTLYRVRFFFVFSIDMWLWGHLSGFDQ